MFEVADAECLTLAEIESRFDGEWVLIVNPELDAHLNIVRGYVVHHSPDREVVEQVARDMRPRSSAVLPVGASFQDDDMLFAL